MMHRPSASARSARKGQNDGALMRAVLAGHMGFDALPSLLAGQIKDIMARRERQQNRAVKRWRKSTSHGGLNGPRAVLRRQRQIAAGSLRVENGLVRA